MADRRRSVNSVDRRRRANSANAAETGGTTMCLHLRDIVAVRTALILCCTFLYGGDYRSIHNCLEVICKSH